MLNVLIRKQKKKSESEWREITQTRVCSQKFDMGDGRRGRPVRARLCITLHITVVPVEFAAHDGFAAPRPQVFQLVVVFAAIQVGGYVKRAECECRVLPVYLLAE
jgi:hypothetical protein